MKEVSGIGRKKSIGVMVIALVLLSVFILSDRMDANAQKAGNGQQAALEQKHDEENTVSFEAVTDNKAEQGEAEKESAAIPEEENANTYLAEAGEFSVKNFDFTVWLLIILFNLALAVSIERGMYLYKNRGNNADLVNIIIKGISKKVDDPGELIKKVKDPRYGMEGRVAAKTLQGWDFGVRAMEEFSRAAIESEQRLLDKRLVVLSTLGNNTPFIGLLGTVLGIMKAFRDLAMIGDAGPAVVMKGISEALIATACGLAVAVPCVIAFNFFSKQVKSKLSNAEEIVKIISGIRSAFERKGHEGVQDFADDDENLFTTGKDKETPVKTDMASEMA